METYSLILNGKPVQFNAQITDTLSHVLRNILKLTGTKEGCGQGECGACTVLLNGKPVNSCIIYMPQVNGQEVTTIEGLAADGKLDPLQQSFIDHGAIQCGYCTPGMILAAKALLLENPAPTREEIKESISGNLCRCTGYKKIIDAIEEVASKGDERADERQ